MKLLKLSLVAVSLFLGSTLAFASNFADTYGFSTQGIALGNAMTARVNDWSSVYYNIAGLGRTAHMKTLPAGVIADEEDPKSDSKKKDSDTDQHSYINDLSITYLRSMTALDININRTDSEGDPLSTDGDDLGSYGFAIIGLAVDLNLIYKMPSFISSARFGLGAGLNDDMTVAKLNDIDMRTHNFLRYGRECQKITAFAGIGLGFLDDMFGFGAGANVGAGGEGTVLLGNVNMESTPQNPDGQSKMDLKAKPSLVAGLYISPGQLFSPLKGFDIGASYRQESYMEIYPFKTSAMAMDDSVVMNMVVAILDYYSPDIYTAGMAYSRWGFTLSADIEYHQWSKYKINASNQINLTDLPELNDIIVYRTGLEYQLISWVSLMIGAYYQPSFISDQAEAGLYNLLDNDKYVGSAGAKIGLPRMFGFGGPVDITVAYQYQYLVKNTVVKDSSAVSSYNPNYNYGGIVQNFAVGLCLKL